MGNIHWPGMFRGSSDLWFVIKITALIVDYETWLAAQRDECRLHLSDYEMNAVESAKRWFYILTGLGILTTGIIGVVGIKLLFNLTGQLSFPQRALAAAVVFALVLLCAIFTLLLMIFFDPKSRVH